MEPITEYTVFGTNQTNSFAVFLFTNAAVASLLFTIKGPKGPKGIGIQASQDISSTSNEALVFFTLCLSFSYVKSKLRLTHPEGC
jgi:CBS domain containing-hemolysin-like protein